MTPERKAELRRLATPSTLMPYAYIVAVCKAIPELLDELEALTADDRARFTCQGCERPIQVSGILRTTEWKQIAPDAEHFTGLLCLDCMDDRLAALGIKTQAHLSYVGRAITGSCGLEELDSDADLSWPSRSLEVSREYFDQLQVWRDSLAAQVARLREALTESTPTACCRLAGCGYDNDYCGYWTAQKALADTEAAATDWLEADRREQRLAGARAYLHWNAGDQPGFIERMMEAFGADLDHEAEAMKREGRQ